MVVLTVGLVVDSQALRRSCDSWRCVARRRNGTRRSVPDGIIDQKLVWPGLPSSFGYISPNSAEPIKGSQYILVTEFVSGELEEWRVKRNGFDPLSSMQRGRKGEHSAASFVVLSAPAFP